jgi:hypothetical protein
LAGKHTIIGAECRWGIDACGRREEVSLRLDILAERFDVDCDLHVVTDYQAAAI